MTLCFSRHKMCGIAVVDMSIEDVRLTNKELEQAMSSAAVAHTEYQRAQIALEIKQTEARGDAEQITILAHSEARKISILAEAEAERIKILDAAVAAASNVRCARRARNHPLSASRRAQVTQQRELVRASAEALSNSNTTMVLGSSTVELGQMLGASAVAGQQMVR